MRTSYAPGVSPVKDVSMWHAGSHSGAGPRSKHGSRAMTLTPCQHASPALTSKHCHSEPDTRTGGFKGSVHHMR
jgi:hypothetical protein